MKHLEESAQQLGYGLAIHEVAYGQILSLWVVRPGRSIPIKCCD